MRKDAEPQINLVKSRKPRAQEPRIIDVVVTVTGHRGSRSVPARITYNPEAVDDYPPPGRDPILSDWE